MTFIENMFSYSGKTVVITGGGGVLAGYIAEGFIEAGAKVSLWGRSMVSLSAAEEKIKSRIDVPEGVLHIFQADCMVQSELEAGYSAVKSELGVPEVLLNGVGGNKGKCNFNDQDIALFMDILKMNLVGGMVLPMQVFTREWIKAGIRGSVLNIASMSSYNGLSGVWAYNAAKSAVMNLTVGTSREFAKHEIRVNSISPGFFVGKQNHDLLIAQDEPLVLTDRGNKIIDRTPMGRFGDFDDLKGAVLFLCSNTAAAFVTGIDVPVDGGFLTDNI